MRTSIASAVGSSPAAHLAWLMERQLGFSDGHIDPIALRLFIRAYWNQVSACAHAIHDEEEKTIPTRNWESNYKSMDVEALLAEVSRLRANPIYAGSVALSMERVERLAFLATEIAIKHRSLPSKMVYMGPL